MIRKFREPTLLGYARLSLEQCYSADKEFWLRVSDSCRTGVARGRDGVLPVSAAIKEVMRDPSITLMMCPLPTQKINAFKFLFFDKVSSTRRVREYEEKA